MPADPPLCLEHVNTQKLPLAVRHLSPLARTTPGLAIDGHLSPRAKTLLVCNYLVCILYLFCRQPLSPPPSAERPNLQNLCSFSFILETSLRANTSLLRALTSLHGVIANLPVGRKIDLDPFLPPFPPFLSVSVSVSLPLLLPPLYSSLSHRSLPNRAG